MQPDARQELGRRRLAERIALSGLSARQYAMHTLLRDERTVRRWLAGDSPIPDPVLDFLLRIRTEREYDEVHAALAPLLHANVDEGHPEFGMLELLTNLISDYDRLHVRLGTPAEEEFIWFRARLRREGERTVIDFPEAPGCSTFAEPGEDAAATAFDALQGWLEARVTQQETPRNDTEHLLASPKNRDRLLRALHRSEEQRGKRQP